MTEKKEKEHKKKTTPGMAATAHRLETSHAVLSALQGVGSNFGTHLVSLDSAALAALVLLKVIQDSEEDVDEDLVDLVIDTCGLVYIIIDACEVDNDHVVRTTNTDFSSLTEAIDNFRVFCMKKIRGSLYRKIKKRSEDEKLMVGFRDHLQAWLVFFGGHENSSIHDHLEGVISRKLRPQIREPKANVQIPQFQKSLAINPSSSYVQNEVPPLPHFSIPAVQVQFPSPSTTSPSGTAPALPSPGLEQPVPVTFPASPIRPSGYDAVESDIRARRRLADEQRRKEERERWRRSEELYNSLPPASPEDSTSQMDNSLNAITAHMKQSISHSIILPQPKPLLKPTPLNAANGPPSRPVSPRLPPTGTVTATVSPPPAEEDPQAARARQVEEDRVTALLLAGEMQLEMEAAGKEKAKRKVSKKHKDKHRPPAIGDTSNGYVSDNGPIPVTVESPSTRASPQRTPPFRTSSLSRSASLSISGSRPASPKMPRPRRSPSPLNHGPATNSPRTHLFPVAPSTELRPLMSASAARDREIPSVLGPRRSSDAVRPLPSPLQQKFSAEDIASDPERGIYVNNVSRSGIAFGSGSVKVRNVGN